MNDPHDNPESPFDTLLRDHLRSTLDGQLGKAEARFQSAIHRAAAASQPKPRRLILWPLAAGAALAASMGIAWAVVRHPTHRDPRSMPQIASTTNEASPSVQPPIPMEQITQYVTLDEGTVVLEDEGPARQLTRQVLQTVQYFDPQQQAHIEITVPREQTVLVSMPRF